jgi:hypothetical protein
VYGIVQVFLLDLYQGIGGPPLVQLLAKVLKTFFLFFTIGVTTDMTNLVIQPKVTPQKQR